MPTSTMYCNAPTCLVVGKPQEIKYAAATYYQPAEWVQDPECGWCQGPLDEDPIYVKELAQDAADWLPEDPDDWDERDRAFAPLVVAYAQHKQEQYRKNLISKGSAA